MLNTHKKFYAAATALFLMVGNVYGSVEVETEALNTNLETELVSDAGEVADSCSPKPACKPKPEPCKPKCEPCKPKCAPKPACKPKCEPCKPKCEPKPACKPKCAPKPACTPNASTSSTTSGN